MDVMLTGLDFSVTFLDDILIRSKSRKEHSEHREKVFKRIKNFGFIKYLGQIIDANRWRPDNERFFALKNMPSPTNVSTLQAFLGLVNYYSVYVPNIHKWKAPLNNLLKKDVKWN